MPWQERRFVCKERNVKKKKGGSSIRKKGGYPTKACNGPLSDNLASTGNPKGGHHKMDIETISQIKHQFFFLLRDLQEPK